MLWIVSASPPGKTVVQPGCRASSVPQNLCRGRSVSGRSRASNAVIAGLTAHGDVLVADFGENDFARKLLVPAFDFLQAKDVGHGLGEEARNKPEAQADGIDIPAGDSKHHAHKKSAQLRRRLGALRFHACAGREAGAGKLVPSARRGGTTDGDWRQPSNAS